MKSIKQLFHRAKPGNEKKEIVRFILKFLLLILMFDYQSATAQNTKSALSVSDKINYSVLIGLGVVFLAAAIYVLNFASKVLRENGKTIEFNFPMIRRMSYNGKTIGVIILLIVLAGIIWAIKF